MNNASLSTIKTKYKNRHRLLEYYDQLPSLYRDLLKETPAYLIPEVPLPSLNVLRNKIRQAHLESTLKMYGREHPEIVNF